MQYTTDDLIKLLNTIKTPDAAGVTANEVSDELGMSLTTTRKYMKKLIRSGRMKLSGKRYVECIDGVARPVPCYQILKGKGKK